MFYSLIHLALLVAATLGVWLLRSRWLLVALGLVLFPLPAALYHYFEAPISPLAFSTPLTPPGQNCSSDSAPARRDPASGLDREKSRNAEDDRQSAGGPDCGSRPDSSRNLILSMILVVNYLTVLIGFLAGVLCSNAVGRRPIATPNMQRPGPPPSPPRSAQRDA
jgi:hypothetical protein